VKNAISFDECDRRKDNSNLMMSKTRRSTHHLINYILFLPVVVVVGVVVVDVLVEVDVLVDVVVSKLNIQK